jgi:uncharacterized lipoprotein YajG
MKRIFSILFVAASLLFLASCQTQHNCPNYSQVELSEDRG